MRVLITGAGGAVASYMIQFLQYSDLDVGPIQIFGITRRTSSSHPQYFSIPSEQRFETHMMDGRRMMALIRDIKPDIVFHFAGMTDVRASFKQSKSYIQYQVEPFINLCEALITNAPSAKLVLASTAEVYGSGLHGHLMAEDEPLAPNNPYAIAKTAIDNLGGYYWRAYGLSVIRVRMFSYICPRRSNLFASDMARQIVAIERGEQEPTIRCGWLGSTRSFMDVSDAVRAYWLAAKLASPVHPYNVGSSEPISLEALLDLMIERAGVSVDVLTDKNLVRPLDIAWQVPNSSVFRKLTGWAPTVSLEDSIALLLTYYRMRT